MKEITYRKAAPDDAAILVDSRIKFLTGLMGEQPPGETEKLKAELGHYFVRALEEQTYLAYLAYAGDEMAGVGGLVLRMQPGNFNNLSGRVGYVLNMYTAPAFRRKGISSRILNLLMEDARQMDVTAFELHATPEGEPVYARNGFFKHHEPTYRKYIE